MDWLNNTESFHSFRGKGIGSSDMPIIMGVSPWKKPHTLWQEKTGLKENNFKGNFATKRGNELEPMVRSWYNDNYGTSMIPESRVHHEHEYLRCNVDGVDHEARELIEIKCGNLSDHVEAHLNGKIPDKYYPQVMFLSYIYQYPISYVSYNPDLREAPFVVIKVEPNLDYTEKMVKEAHKFWDLVLNKIPPNLDDSEDLYVEDKNMATLIKEYKGTKETVDRATLRLKEIQAELSAKTTHKKTVCNGYRLAWVERKGAIDYSKVPEVEGVDLEQYRKKGSKFFTMKEVKSE